MGRRHQRSIRLVRVARVKWHTEHETVRFDGVLVHGSFIPNLVGGLIVRLAKVSVN